MSRVHAFYLLILMSFNSYGQIGGQRAFEFLNVPNNARLSALGGVNITSGWDDLTQGTSNPALINTDWNQELAVAYLSYFADISNTSVSFASSLKDLGVWNFNLTYFNYGQIESYDQQGALQGELSVKEYAFSIGYAKEFGAFSIGANTKIAVSDLSSFQASALMLDIGGAFKHPEKDMAFGMTIKNLGFLLADYTDFNDSQLPLDIQLGFSYKPEFMPLRFSISAKNLLSSDLIYFDPASNSLFGETEPGVGDQIFRRLVFGAEIIFSPNFQLRAGYNHMLRQELKLEDVAGGAGLSFGFMFKVKRFEFAFARALYHVAGGSNTFQINMNTGGLIKRNNK